MAPLTQALALTALGLLLGGGLVAALHFAGL